MIRQTAFLVKVGELLEGKPAEMETGEPSALFIPSRKLVVGRANLVGFIISKESPGTGFDEFTLDDGSGTITVRNFDSSISFNAFAIGDVVNVIGRVRDYNSARYVIPEVVRKVDGAFLKLRELEIAFVKLPSAEEPKNPAKTVLAKKPLDEASPKQGVYETIQEMDTGTGVDIQELRQKCQVKDIDRVINMLIEEGEIFKLGPSRVKVL